MHTENLEVLRKEAVRLVDLESALLERVSGIHGLVSATGKNEQQTLDSESLQHQLEILSGERTKLETLDMVVAVVGTMKAGKSTTINAIVGAEVLPNRNAPMTAIPTLIRHTPGYKEPRVLFNNNKPVNQLCQRISEILVGDPSLSERISHEAPELTDALTFVRQGEPIATEYRGQAGIFDFLRSINDLVRICRALDLEFPFSDYDETHELPVIEVEFAALSDQESALGRLTLLDTPGPNEAGQKHLKVMLRDQLRKASAVIAVLNYNQLKSQGDQDLQDEINAVTSLAKGRVYAFVNRFDEKRRNDPDEESIKRMVNRRFDNEIPIESIFAVSAYRAFISELAQNSLDTNGRLPDPEKPENGWVEEFASATLGLDWQDELDDLESVSRAAKAFWDKSGFERPLERVIHSAHQNAAYYAMDSTASKLVNLAERLSNFINSRNTALSKTALELQKHIDSLRQDAQRVASLREEKEAEANKMIANLRSRVSAALAQTRNEGKNITETLFKRGVIEQDKKESEARNMSKAERDRKGLALVSDEKKNIGTAYISAHGGRTSDRSREEGDEEDRVMDPYRRELEFSSSSEARKFLSKIEEALEAPMTALSERLGEALEATYHQFGEELEVEIAQKSDAILSEVSQRLGDDGFIISLRVPDSVDSSAFTIRSLSMKKGIRAAKKPVTRLREQQSVGSGVKRFFGTVFRQDWGYEEYKTNIKVFQISLDELNAITNKLLEEQEKEWQSSVDEEVEAPINAALEKFFSELEKKVEGLRGDLLQGVADKEKSKSEQDELLDALQSMSRDLPGLQEDSEALQQDTRSHLKERLDASQE